MVFCKDLKNKQIKMSILYEGETQEYMYFLSGSLHDSTHDVYLVENSKTVHGDMLHLMLFDMKLNLRNEIIGL